ncbi:hypothetical protein GIB67_040163, partial [Kingdonia uniflora]
FNRKYYLRPGEASSIYVVLNNWFFIGCILMTKFLTIQFGLMHVSCALYFHGFVLPVYHYHYKYALINDHV